MIRIALLFAFATGLAAHAEQEREITASPDGQHVLVACEESKDPPRAQWFELRTPDGHTEWRTLLPENMHRACVTNEGSMLGLFWEQPPLGTRAQIRLVDGEGKKIVSDEIDTAESSEADPPTDIWVVALDRDQKHAWSLRVTFGPLLQVEKKISLTRFGPSVPRQSEIVLELPEELRSRSWPCNMVCAPGAPVVAVAFRDQHYAGRPPSASWYDVCLAFFDTNTGAYIGSVPIVSGTDRAEANAICTAFRDIYLTSRGIAFKAGGAVAGEDAWYERITFHEDERGTLVMRREAFANLEALGEVVPAPVVRNVSGDRFGRPR